MNENQLLREALAATDAVSALIKHQYTGTSIGMTDLQIASDLCDAVSPKIRAALAQPAEGGEVDNVKSSAGLIRPGKVDAWVANHYTTPPASQEQAVARFNWYKGGFEWLVPYNFDRHNMRPLYLAPEGAEAARKAAQEQLYAERERHTAEVKKLQAEIGRLNASHSQAQQPEEWRDVMQERFDLLHFDMPTDPREAIAKLVYLETTIALDPAVSGAAEALIQRGRDEAQQPSGGEVVDMKRRLVRIHDALCSDLGDTDPDMPDDMTDDEVCEEMPVFWAAKEVADLIGNAPWDKYTTPPAPSSR